MLNIVCTPHDLFTGKCSCQFTEPSTLAHKRLFYFALFSYQSLWIIRYSWRQSKYQIFKNNFFKFEKYQLDLLYRSIDTQFFRKMAPPGGWTELNSARDSFCLPATFSRFFFFAKSKNLPGNFLILSLIFFVSYWKLTFHRLQSVRKILMIKILWDEFSKLSKWRSRMGWKAWTMSILSFASNSSDTFWSSFATMSEGFE